MEGRYVKFKRQRWHQFAGTVEGRSFVGLSSAHRQYRTTQCHGAVHRIPKHGAPLVQVNYQLIVSAGYLKVQGSSKRVLHRFAKFANYAMYSE